MVTADPTETDRRVQLFTKIDETYHLLPSCHYFTQVERTLVLR